jgi:hypothetical protein
LHAFSDRVLAALARLLEHALSLKCSWRTHKAEEHEAWLLGLDKNVLNVAWGTETKT